MDPDRPVVTAAQLDAATEIGLHSFAVMTDGLRSVGTTLRENHHHNAKSPV
jgi:uncharacterized protein with ATP-grasp and redox domains